VAVQGEKPNSDDALKIDPGSGSIIIDPSHELYLYPSDNPSHVLVNNLLDGRNYGHWRKAAEIALIAKNKIGFV